MGRGGAWIKVLAAALLLALAAAVAVFWNRRSGVSLAVGFDDRIELTPQEILRMERIGQWEFLSVQSEVVVDTLRSGWMSDDRLVAVYTGTPRFGIDMSRVEEGWAVAHGDTATLRLPAVSLLDKDFIDEARTRVFYERGKWSNQARGEMYARAYREMLRQCCTPDNLKRAEENARSQFTAMFRAMGFGVVEVHFVRNFNI